MRSSPTASARFLFFGGKGGTGKTTCAAAAAIQLAEPVLALSLDPAHSLRDVLGASSAVDIEELDARAEFATFMDKHREQLGTIADRGTYLDKEDIQAFLDLSLPGLDEIMGLLELGRLARADSPRRVIVDLPPTGHALRLFDVADAFDQLVEALELMQDKHRFAVASLTRRYAQDAIDAFLDDLRESCRAARQALFERGTSAFVLVARPEPMVLAETARFAGRLRRLGAPPAALVLNAAPAEVTDPLPAELAGLAIVRVPWLERAPVGTEGLRPVAEALAPLLGVAAKKRHSQQAQAPATAVAEATGIRPLLERPRRLTIFGGKGGVGKTTLAAATALALSDREPPCSVVVVSIDPAHSLGDSLGQELGPEPRPVAGEPRLLACELDPKEQWRSFKEHWQAQGEALFQGLPRGSHLDPVYDRKIAAQLGKIQPTGLDEIQAACAIIDLLDEDPDRLVVVDSAPTGHLLRFLESPSLVLGWAKELMRILVKYGLAGQLKGLSHDLLDLSRKTKRLDALLRDPEQCEVVVVALAEEPVLAETERLIGRLEAMNVPIRRLVWNQVDTAGKLHAREMEERHPELQTLSVARRVVPVQGVQALAELAA